MTSIADHLDKPDTAEALTGFCVEFLRIHLSDEHLATVRLLIAEARRAPELTEVFTAAGPDDTETRLASFLEDRFDIAEPTQITRALAGTLLTLRDDVLVGLPPPSPQDIHDHATRTADLFLSVLRS